MTGTVLALAVLAALEPAQPPPAEILAAVHIQGNVLTPDSEVLRLAALEIGAPIEPTTMADVAARLRATHRFRRVDVLKRFASLTDPTQIALVIIVDEGPVAIQTTHNPEQPTRVVRLSSAHLLAVPLANVEDGYGVSYGGNVAVLDVAGTHSRLSAPLTWGADKRAALTLEKRLDTAWIDRVELGGSVGERIQPFFKQTDFRERVWGRAERQMGRAFHVGVTSGWQHVSFLNVTDSFFHTSVDAVLDTRSDPVVPRNAVYVRGSIEHVDIRSGTMATRSDVDGQAFLGCGPGVLVVRTLWDDADQHLPPYLQPILGGMANLPGFRAGTAIGDALTVGSAEWRVPIASVLGVGKVGVSVFTASGTTYDIGEALASQRFRDGFGGGGWLAAGFLHVTLAVAHGVGAATHVYVDGSLSF